MPLSLPITIDLFSMLISLGAGLFIAHHWPPRPLAWAVPAAIICAFLFALGDMGARLFASQPPQAWMFTLCLYVGLSGVVYFWWKTSLGIAQLQGVSLGAWETVCKRLPLVGTSLLIGLIATNPWHGQFVTLFPERNDYHLIWYYYASFSYALVLATMVLAGYLGVRARSKSDRRQAVLIFVGSALPPIANLIYVIPASPMSTDPTQIGVAICVLLFVTAIYRDRIYAASAVPLERVLSWDSEPTLLMDTDGRLIHANAPAHKLFAGQLVSGHNVLQPIGKLLNISGDISMLHHLQNPVIQVEEHFRTQSTPPRWYRLEAKPVRPSSSHTGTIIRLCDETEKVRANEIRSELELFSLLQNIIDTTQGAICVTDGKNRIRHANTKFLEFSSAIQINEDALIEDVFAQFDVLVNLGYRFGDALVSITEDSEITIDCDLELVDGRLIKLYSTPLRVDYDFFRGRLWQYRDITLQRRAEETQRDSHVLESLGSMAAGVAHDFNNLLTAVMGNAELAAEYLDSEPDRVRKTLQRISEAAEKGAHMTHQLLSYTGKTKNGSDWVNLSKLGEEILSFFDSSIDSSISIERDFSPSLPLIRGDASQIGQVLMNLIINARDAIGDSGGCIRVTTGKTIVTEVDLKTVRFSDAVKPGNFSFIDIRDDGCGMDKNTLSRIFDPFFSTKESGSGLGLAATLGITKSHNGFITVDSVLGQGTHFVLFLPVALQVAVVQSLSDVITERTWRSHGKALLADDNASVRSVTKAYLRAAGLSVVEAQNGEEALHAWEQNTGKFELAVIDLTMPGMSGQQLMQRLREQNPDLPVLLISGYSRDPLNNRDLSGNTNFLAKPFRLETFLDAVQKIILVENTHPS